MAKDTFYILTTPESVSQLHPWAVLPACLAYRLSPNLSLLRLRGAQNLRGGLMVISDCTADPRGVPERFCLEVLQECTYRGYRGVILDFERTLPLLTQLVRRLGEVLSRRGITLFVPEPYAPHAPNAKVLIPSALSGGSLTQRLETAVQCFGPGRVVLAVEQAAEDFILPAPEGCGRSLSAEELEQLKAELRPHTFFSQPLCARYFTYRRGEEFHFVLFDDLHTLCQKTHTARCAGIHQFLLPWQAISSAPERFSIPPKKP